VLACLAACSTTTQVQTHINADASVNYGKYRTFAFSPPTTTLARMNPAARATVQSALTSGLAAQGITPSSTPDFVIVYHVTTADRSSVQEYNQWQYGFDKVNDGTGAGSFYTYGAFMGNEISETQYTQGTFIVDFVDARTRKMFWRGTSMGRVGTLQKNEQELTTGVSQMLAQFPPAR
jgi:hypothetical protein